MDPSDLLLERLVQVFADGVRKRPKKLRKLTDWELVCFRAAREKQAARRAASAKVQAKKRSRRAKQLEIDFDVEFRQELDLPDPQEPAAVTADPACESFVADDDDVPF